MAVIKEIRYVCDLCKKERIEKKENNEILKKIQIPVLCRGMEENYFVIREIEVCNECFEKIAKDFYKLYKPEVHAYENKIRFFGNKD